MTVNATIRTVDYNNIRTKVVNVMGNGSGNTGYGQTLVSSPVDEGNRVTVNEWGNLRWDIINAYVHQFGSVPTLSQATVGGTVRSNPTNSPYTQYDTFANTIVTNRFKVDPNQALIANKGSTSRTWDYVNNGTFWRSLIESTVTVSWTNSDQARYFFNAGGQVRFASSRTDGVENPTNTTVVGWQQNDSWTSLLSTASQQLINSFDDVTAPRLRGNYPTVNFYTLTSTYQEFYRATASSTYSSNSWRIQVRTGIEPSTGTRVANNSNGTASILEFSVQWVDNYTDPGSPAPGDGVDGTIDLQVSTAEATGVLQPPGTGNFAVESPTVSISAITGS